MRILVTGGAGFIGSNFIRYWLTRHAEDTVINFDALTYAGNLENLADVADNPQYIFIKGDICNREVVAEAMKGVDVVVHFAAESHVDRSILGPEAFVKTNIYGTYILLEEARKNSVRFHHVSTDEVFGSLELGSREQFDESTPYDPSSPYSASKASSDHLVRAYHHTYNLPVTISNTSNNYGPYMFPEKLIPLAITRLMEDKPVPIYGEGNQVRDWLYVLDHCRAIELILEKGVVGETYLIGGMSKDVTNLEVVKQIIQIMGKGEHLVEHVNDRPGHDERYSVNWTKARSKLGYQPEHDFETYLAQTVTWYQEHEPWWRRIMSGEYQDYYQTQYGKA
jgi:dTDP-glucose 4,6-dehydratase